MDLTRELELATRAAREAGARLREMMTGPRTVLSQEGRDIKMQADRDAEAIILAALRADSPLPILTEETGEHGDPGRGRYWAIDPLDGTLNFSRALALCCTSIGLMDGERPLLGVIYDFNADELFTGIAGQGAWLNGQPIRVSGLTDRTQAIIAAGMPTYSEFTDEALRELIQLYQTFKKARMFGSAALHLAGVACGRVDAYIEKDVMMWDIAAGSAIIDGAGGWIEIQQGSVGRWSRRVRAAATPALLA